MEKIILEWFYVAVMLLSGLGALYFCFKMLFRLILFIACLVPFYWAANKLELIDKTTIKKFIKQSKQQVLEVQEDKK